MKVKLVLIQFLPATGSGAGFLFWRKIPRMAWVISQTPWAIFPAAGSVSPDSGVGVLIHQAYFRHQAYEPSPIET